MKKILIIFCILFRCALSHAQITITQSDLPAANDVWGEYFDGAPGPLITITPASSSPQAWDFSTAFTITDSTADYFLPASQVINGALFPNATFGLNYGDTLTGKYGAFYFTDPSGWYFDGSFEQSADSTWSIESHDSNLIIMPTPLTYGSYYPVNFKDVSLEIYASGNPDRLTISHSSIYFMCDAFGTLKTPINPLTPVDVLRVKNRFMSETDSTFEDPTHTGNFTFINVTNYGPSDYLDYFFLKNKNGCSSIIVYLQYDSVNQVVDNAQYIDCNAPLGISALASNEKSCIAYPNPSSSSSINIRITNAAAQFLEINDSNGNLIKKVNLAGVNTVKISTESLINGMYYFQTSDKQGNKTGGGKFVIAK